jgi:hypothetical protein
MEHTLENYNTLIINWAKDRGILDNSSIRSQTLKALAEYGELCDSIGKNTAVQDDIGDIYVVLTIVKHLILKQHNGKDVEPLDVDEEIYDTNEENFILLGGLLLSLLSEENWNIEEKIIISDHASYLLNKIADEYDLTLVECVAHAYEEIKDRKGYLSVEGIFIKESDEAYEIVEDVKLVTNNSSTDVIITTSKKVVTYTLDSIDSQNLVNLYELIGLPFNQFSTLRIEDVCKTNKR